MMIYSFNKILFKNKILKVLLKKTKAPLLLKIINFNNQKKNNIMYLSRGLLLETQKEKNKSKNK